MASLSGRRILITRPQGRASRLAELLIEAGAEPMVIPTIELRPPENVCALDAALATLRSFDWLLFTSASAVEVFAQRARTLGLPATPRRVAAIGPATARAIVDAGIATQIDLVPPQAVAESFAEALLPHAAGASMLLVRAAVARETLPGALAAAGATVTIAEAYRTVMAEASIATLRELLRGPGTNRPDAITFTSASTAVNLAALLDAAELELPAGLVLASIGPITSQAMRELRWEPSVEATQASIPSLVDALSRAFSV